MGLYRVSTPVPDFSGEVGGCVFVDGVYEGDVADGPLSYFTTAGYGLEDLTVDPDGPGGLPPKAATRGEWEQVARDLGITEEEIGAASNKDQLIELVVRVHDQQTAAAQAADTPQENQS